MKNQYFKIVQLPEHEVLVMKDWDEQDESPTLVFVFFLDGIKVQQSLRYENTKSRDKNFDKANEELCQVMVNNFLGALYESE